MASGCLTWTSPCFGHLLPRTLTKNHQIPNTYFNSFTQHPKTIPLLRASLTHHLRLGLRNVLILCQTIHCLPKPKKRQRGSIPSSKCYRQCSVARRAMPEKTLLNMDNNRLRDRLLYEIVCSTTRHLRLHIVSHLLALAPKDPEFLKGPDNRTKILTTHLTPAPST